MAKVFVVDIDLGINIDQLIETDIIELTQPSKDKLQQVIEVAQLAQVQLQKKSTEQTRISGLLDRLYADLVTANTTGLPSDIINSAIQGIISNMSAFTLRMKSVLSERGNQYIMEKQKRNGIMYYVFTPFNLPIANEPTP